MSRTKVKRTTSKSRMKQLIKQGYELEGIETRKQLGGTTWIGSWGRAYILVKRPEKK